jgi:hypothetical protein
MLGAPRFEIIDNRKAAEERAVRHATHVDFNDDLKEHTQQNYRNYSEDECSDLGSFWREGN